MGENTKEESDQSSKDELTTELTKFLKNRSQESKPRFPFLDRPFFLTLFGTVFITLLTSCWQLQQHRYELKLELLREVSGTYEKKGNILNFWLRHVLWIAEANNKLKKLKKEDVESREKLNAIIKFSTEEVTYLRHEFIKTDDPDAVLIKIQGVYKSPEVRIKADELLTLWNNFENLLQETNVKIRNTKFLREDDIKKTNSYRSELRDKMNELKKKLLFEMGRELSDKPWILWFC